LLELFAITTTLDGGAHRFDLPHHRTEVIVRAIVDACGLAVADAVAFLHRNHGDLEIDHRSSSDPERHAQRPLLEPRPQGP